MHQTLIAEDTMRHPYWIASIILLLVGCSGGESAATPTANNVVMTPTPTFAVAELPATNTSSPIPAPTVFPTPAWCPLDQLQAKGSAQLRFAYVQDGDLWVWDYEKSDKRRLTSSGDLGIIDLSDDGRMVAFTRNEATESASLWYIDLMDMTTYQVMNVGGMTRLDPHFAEAKVSRPRFIWIPRSHTLRFFFTGDRDPDSGGIVCDCFNSASYLFDIDTAFIQIAQSLGAYSPDAQWTVFTESVVNNEQQETLVTIRASNGETTNQQQIPESSIIPMGEIAGSSEAEWSPDSQSVLITLQSQQDGTLSVWRVPLHGDSTRLSSYTGDFLTFTIDPNGELVTFLGQLNGTSNLTIGTLFLASTENGLSWPIADNVTGHAEWSPDSHHFIFRQGDNQLMLSDICGDVRPLFQKPDQYSASAYFHWLDSERLIYITPYWAATSDPSIINLITTEGVSTVIGENWSDYDYVQLP